MIDKHSTPGVYILTSTKYTTNRHGSQFNLEPAAEDEADTVEVTKNGKVIRRSTRQSWDISDYPNRNWNTLVAITQIKVE